MILRFDHNQTTHYPSLNDIPLCRSVIMTISCFRMKSVSNVFHSPQGNMNIKYPA